MAPRRAAEEFRGRFTNAAAFRVTLYGSLAATGKGHLTDCAIREVFSPIDIEICWRPDESLPTHPNGMLFQAIDHGKEVGRWTVYSIGGGALREAGDVVAERVYGLTTMTEIIGWSRDSGRPLWEYVDECEGNQIWEYLAEAWEVMHAAVLRGIDTDGALPGPLRLARKSASYHAKARCFEADLRRTGLLSAYALGVAEENAAGGTVVTAPTCGSCGVVPAVLTFISEVHGCTSRDVLHALATAGLFGNVVKENASISGAEVGCQGEIGTACAMAAAAAAQLMGGTPSQIEYASEMGMEHHLGLTCDPVGGLVQIPCIERNAFAATRAFDCAAFALLSDGSHRISFDDVVTTMKQTGADLQARYRETSTGGLAETYRLKHHDGKCLEG
jgi:L-serine dehydratase